MSRWKYFRESEFACRHCGQNHIDHRFVDKLDALRGVCGFPLVVISGYRCPQHPIEVSKAKPGVHCSGLAADLSAPDGVKMRRLVMAALAAGFTGIGVNHRSVHLDVRPRQPVMWGYE